MRLQNVSKRYFLNPKTPWNLRGLIAHPRTVLRQLWPREPFWALRDVSLEVPKGQILGIIGSNGSGKSTLLSTMVGISPPTKGSVTVDGRYAALLELGAGFHASATGRENAYVNALFMGLSKKQARELLPEIIEFSGLGQFADQPMRTYSSGMYVRLGFSVAVHVQPEILVIDEILAVGDADFQQKCYEHFSKLKEQKVTIIVVTHAVNSLRDFADRVVHMDHGQVANDGTPDEVINDYIMSRYHASDAVKASFQRVMREQGLLPDEEAEQSAAHESVER